MRGGRTRFWKVLWPPPSTTMGRRTWCLFPRERDVLSPASRPISPLRPIFERPRHTQTRDRQRTQTTDRRTAHGPDCCRQITDQCQRPPPPPPPPAQSDTGTLTHPPTPAQPRQPFPLRHAFFFFFPSTTRQAVATRRQPTDRQLTLADGMTSSNKYIA